MRLRVETLEDPTRRQRFLTDLDEMDDMVNGALNLFRGVDDSEGQQRTDISALLKELRSDFAELGISIAIEGTTDGGIWLKPQALKRCLTNLLSNAAKYGDHATLIIEEREDLVIRVLDDGPGIPEADLERVFEPFYRVESSRNPETGGTGLGLCIARDIAQAHGGSLVLRNRSPHGLEAILTLPRSEPIGLVE
jgi:signal transduction histidine kinase